MDDHLALALRAKQELEPAVREFASAVGRSRPGAELVEWLGDLVYYRRLPHKAKLLMRAAERIRASGLPTSAVSDKLLRSVLEEGSLEDDPEMQERWAGLLASAATGTTVPPSFPDVLRQPEALEAQLLDRVVAYRPERPTARLIDTPLSAWGPLHALEYRHLDNLERLALIQYTVDLPVNVRFDRPVDSPDRVLLADTPFARAFVNACQATHEASAHAGDTAPPST